MPFGAMAPSHQQKSQVTSHSSPVSGYDRSSSEGLASYTTDDLAHARYTKYSRGLEWVRIVLTVITLAISIAVTACAGVSLEAYSESHVQPDWLLPLWPLNVDLRPSHALLGCGITVIVLSLVYLIAAFAPMVSYQPFRGGRNTANGLP